MYSIFHKIYKISQFAQFTYGSKITLEQLETSITMIIQSVEPKTIRKFVDFATRDFSPLMTPQFKKEGEYYIPMPSLPKTPNKLVGDAYTQSLKNQDKIEKEEIERFQKGEN